MKRLQIEQQDPIAALEELDSSIALEHLSLRTITNRVMDAIPNLVHQARQVLGRVQLPANKPLHYTYNQRVLEKAINEFDYMKVARLNVHVPKGFSGQLVDYLAVLASAATFTGDTIARLTVYNQFLSALISHPDTRASTKEYITALADRDTARQEITNSMAAFFTAKNTTDRLEMGVAFARAKDVLTAAAAVGEVVDMVGRDDAKQLHALVRDCAELLDALRDAGRRNQLSNMSPEVFKNLASATLSMARDVELVGAVHFAIGQVAESMMATSAMLIDIIRYSDEKKLK